MISDLLKTAPYQFLYFLRAIARVHEACTWMNSNNVHNAGDDCAYWTNGNGDMFHGSKYSNTHNVRYVTIRTNNVV